MLQRTKGQTDVMEKEKDGTHPDDSKRKKCCKENKRSSKSSNLTRQMEHFPDLLDLFLESSSKGAAQNILEWGSPLKKKTKKTWKVINEPSACQKADQSDCQVATAQSLQLVPLRVAKLRCDAAFNSTPAKASWK